MSEYQCTYFQTKRSKRSQFHLKHADLATCILVSQHACAACSSQEMSLLMEMSHRQHGPQGSLINLVSDNQQSFDPASHWRKPNTTASAYKVEPSGGCKTSYTTQPLRSHIYLTSISHKNPNVQYIHFLSRGKEIFCWDHKDLFLLKLQCKNVLSYMRYD